MPQRGTCTLPTGLFQFDQIDLPGLHGTVPQSVYHGNSYLATGYGGQSARLPPGTYTVRYHSHDQEPLCHLVTDWLYTGPIPKANEPADVMQQVFPPEIYTNLRGSFNVAGRDYFWSPLETTLGMNLRPEMQNKGVNAMLIYEINKVYVDKGIKFVESNRELENNAKVQAQWRFYDARQHKRRRIYKKTLGDA